MINGMILAAGRGTRLGPLTESLPKPLLPVANRPIMALGIERLRQLGITDICVNVSYRAEQILATFGDGCAFGVSMHWLIEEAPSGTAGGLKGMQAFLDTGRVVVIAGDTMLGADLNPLLEIHARRGAFATLATVPVHDPSLYGVVVTDADGRIVRFQEKPAPGTEISRQANTGVYIFEPEIFDLIPTGEFCDFALNVFPEILRRGLPFYAMPLDGYWTDIGNPRDYLQANRDVLHGRTRINGYGQRCDSNLLAPTARVDGTLLHECTVGDGAHLAAGCVLTDCVVWPGAVVTRPLTLTSGVVTEHGSFTIQGKEALALAEAAAGA